MDFLYTHIVQSTKIYIVAAILNKPQNFIGLHRNIVYLPKYQTGQHEIDDFHPCTSFKFIKDKPIRDLTGDEFLNMYGAQKEGLVTLSLSMDKEGTKDTYIEEIKTFFYRDEFSQLVQVGIL